VNDTDWLYGDVVNQISYEPALDDPTGTRFALLDRRALLQEIFA